MSKLFKLLGQIALLFVLIAFEVWVTRTDMQAIQSETSLEARQDRGEVIDDNNDNEHDQTCMCSLCESGDYESEDSTHYLHSIYFKSLKNK